jgi:hypothetical protein
VGCLTASNACDSRSIDEDKLLISIRYVAFAALSSVRILWIRGNALEPAGCGLQLDLGQSRETFEIKGI